MKRLLLIVSLVAAVPAAAAEWERAGDGWTAVSDNHGTSMLPLSIGYRQGQVYVTSIGKVDVGKGLSLQTEMGDGDPFHVELERLDDTTYRLKGPRAPKEIRGARLVGIDISIAGQQLFYTFELKKAVRELEPVS